MAKAGKAEALTGLRKAAILMIVLDTEASSKIMSHLNFQEVEAVSMEIAKCRDEIDPEVRDMILREFYQTHMARKYMDQGGYDYAKSLLERSLSPEEAAKILALLDEQIQQPPFHFLKQADTSNLLMYIQEEHPQTIALIMAHVQPKQASEILCGLPPKKQMEVIKRIARMEQTTPEAIRQVEAELESRLAAVVGQDLERAGGVEAVAGILNLCDRTTEKGILENLEEADPDMVEQIRRLMFVFEDILLVNDRGIQSVLREVQPDELATALKTASEALQEKIFKNMSERAALSIKENMEFMGPVRLADVEAAQQRIVDVVRRMEESGDVVIAGRGGDEEQVV